MTRLRSAPQSRRQYVWPLDGDVQAVGHARTTIRTLLTQLKIAADIVDDAVLMVSELVTNAFLYGDAPYEMVLNVDHKEIVCVVVDSGEPLPAPRAPDLHSEGGRGLHIVAALSNGVHGSHRRHYLTWPELTGKATWFALPRIAGAT
ncbi:ATP-binding protein [Nonomuraea glycinis]|uniref:ATP-binding protein n=1 Tax=Nonomuraea glycinis TaxID=2047744 RepID=UPI002E12B524|nr:ATP-binding protein [Nonomuraea glycinis]